jgi:polysaccharide deacetylase family protein (PEP-CTERM system associated)
LIRNALTFDIEEYFHVEAAARAVSRQDWERYPSRVEHTTGRILDLLDGHRVTATFFVLGWVAERYPGLVRDIDARGHEIACHSYAHRLIYTMAQDEFRDDVRRAKATIEDTIGAAIHGYRAPTFSIVEQSSWALQILAEEGFTYDSSIFPIHHDRYGVPTAPRFPHRIQLDGGRDILEFPMTTIAVGRHRLPLCGGGYFRLWPYSAISAGLRWVNEHEREPGIVYLHPWEFDPEQPRLPIRGVNRLRHYLNIGGTARKLERLMEDFRFAAVRDVLHARGSAETVR